MSSLIEQLGSDESCKGVRETWYLSKLSKNSDNLIKRSVCAQYARYARCRKSLKIACPSYPTLCSSLSTDPTPENEYPTPPTKRFVPPHPDSKSPSKPAPHPNGASFPLPFHPQSLLHLIPPPPTSDYLSPRHLRPYRPTSSTPG